MGMFLSVKQFALWRRCGGFADLALDDKERQRICMRQGRCQGRVVVQPQVAFEPDQGTRVRHVGGHGYCRVWLARWRRTTAPRSNACLVRRPAIRLRHMRNEEGFICRRIKAMTADSFRPNWASMVSNAVRSSHAISTMREILASQGATEPP